MTSTEIEHREVDRHPTRWTRHPETGAWVAPQKQSMLLDFLTTPRELRAYESQAEWAKAHGVSEYTIRDWKRDPRFYNELWLRARQILSGPDTIVEIFNYIARMATDDEAKPETRLKYINLYLKLIDQMGDKPRSVTLNIFQDQRSIEERSDEELARMAGIVDAEVIEDDASQE